MTDESDGEQNELKLDLSAHVAEQAAELTWVREFAGGPAKRETLSTVYFDTAKRKLHVHGVSLRVRQRGDRRVRPGTFGRDRR